MINTVFNDITKDEVSSYKPILNILGLGDIYNHTNDQDERIYSGPKHQFHSLICKTKT